jgi:PPK2 family polyphosphate:nucleotide phosphotransferase
MASGRKAGDPARNRSKRRPSPLGDRLRVKPGTRVNLASIDPSDTHGHQKLHAERDLAAGLARLTSLQERIWAESKHAVLVVLQGIDASGKDGTVTHVMGAFNPLGCPVTSFKVPNSLELAHDYLWRVHARVPARGEIGIFNRSHYEEVLVVRVHDLVPKSVWSQRFDQINDFERMLSESGTTIVKFFLWVDRDEQRARFQARLDDPTKRWKFAMGDLDERKLWDSYVGAFEDALSKCSTEWAPWYVIPANRKWFRNLAVAEILADTLDALDPQYPKPANLPAVVE